MPKETDADRILRERRLQSQAQEKMRQQEAARQAETKRVNYIREIESEISRILPLTHLDYASMIELDVVTKTRQFFGGYRQTRSIKAAWIIGTYQHGGQGDSDVHTSEIYLVSDGTICFGRDVFYGSHPYLPQEMNKPNFNLGKVLSGLQDLRKKLEALKNK